MPALKRESQIGESILEFYAGLNPDISLPDGISIMNPYRDKSSWEWVEKFYRLFYADSSSRRLIFGINPGRYGGGITGIPFTDPIRLEQECGIPNHLRKLPELSSVFMYGMMQQFGGAAGFYGRFLVTAISPLGFTRDGKNLNYYDDRALVRSAEPFIVDCIRWHASCFPSEQTVYCLGEGENFRCFSRLNDQYGFFHQIVPLPHPRWVMQYRRKKINDYFDLYREKLNMPGSSGLLNK
jgi:hypothetical protein